MAYQSQDIIRRSATNGFTPAPQARDHQQEVAKLIDVTTCIGCKACQVGVFRVERHPRRGRS
jgi:formate dehydrogenase beta subunit (EC 1.2.1.2)